jgi:hypothetical protein
MAPINKASYFILTDFKQLLLTRTAYFNRINSLISISTASLNDLLINHISVTTLIVSAVPCDDVQ